MGLLAQLRCSCFTCPFSSKSFKSKGSASLKELMKGGGNVGEEDDHQAAIGDWPLADEELLQIEPPEPPEEDEKSGGAKNVAEE